MNQKELAKTLKMGFQIEEICPVSKVYTGVYQRFQGLTFLCQRMPS